MRRPISSRGRSRSSRMTQSAVLPQPAGLFLPAAHRLRAVVRQRGRASRRAYATDPTDGVRASPGWSRRCSGRSRCGSPTWPARGSSTATSALLAAAIFGLAFLPDLLQPPGAQRRAHAGPGGAVAVRHRRGDAPRPAARLRDRRASGVGLAAATKYTGGITLRVPAGGVRLRRRRRRVSGWPRAGARWRCAVALLAFVVANPYSVLDFSAFQSGDLRAGVAGGGRQDPVKLGTDAGSGIDLLPVDVHLGPGLGPDAGRARRRGAAAGPAAAGDGAGAAAGADRLHHLHGRPAALLRPLADADLPDRGDARRLRRGRAGAVAGPRAADPGPGGGRAGRRCCCWPRAWSRWSTTMPSCRGPTPAT